MGLFCFPKFSKIVNFFTLSVITVFLSSCDIGQVGSSSKNQIQSGQSNKFNTNGIKSQDSLAMDLKWTIDGRLDPEGLSTDLRDTAWHLLTLSVANVGQDIQPTKVGGLIYEIRPRPIPDYGQDLELRDINCESATFAKAGDSCSAYIRLKYDVEKFPKVDRIVFSIKMAPNNDEIPGLMSFAAAVSKKDDSIAEYRVVLPIETQYYAGSAVSSNKNLYQMLLIKNTKSKIVNITNISPPQNLNFQLIHRASIESSDAYYAGFKECSLTNDTTLNQVNHLDNFEDECLLVYQVSATSTDAIQRDLISIATDAEFYYPGWPKAFNLVANYASGVPIPQQDKSGVEFEVATGNAHPEGASMVMDTDGVLTSGVLTPSYNPFKLVNLSYQFTTPRFDIYAPYGIPIYQEDTINIDSQNNLSIAPGMQILTDASSTNPVTVGKVTQLVTPQSSTSGKSEVWACGGARALANASISTSVDLTNRGLVHLHVTGGANAACQNWRENTIEEDIPLNGYSKTVFSQDDQGCGGGTWDIGGKVWVDGGNCSVDSCSYTVYVQAHHGGAPEQCHDTQTTNFVLNFMRPQVYTQLSQLSNFNLVKPIPYTLALAGQNLNATLGTEGGFVAQNINYNSDFKYWQVDGLYSNGLSSTNMSYNIGLRTGNKLKSGSVNFTRSSGYDLSDFTITQEDPTTPKSHKSAIVNSIRKGV